MMHATFQKGAQNGFGEAHGAFGWRDNGPWWLKDLEPHVSNWLFPFFFSV
ncbi:MAG: hypothetical protein WBG48_00555 [Pricia sp.]